MHSHGRASDVGTVIGFTAHQRLEAGSVDWLRDAVRCSVAGRGARCGISSLAPGADQLFADVLAGLGVEHQAIEPSDGSQEAFVEAGKWIVANCDLLVAVWDGLPAGGPADVVAFAAASNRLCIQINPVTRSISVRNPSPRD